MVWCCRSLSALAGAVAFSALSFTSPVMAAEGGHGVYLLGLKGAGAGISPPEGVFFANNLYYYEGSNEANRPFPAGGNQIVANVDADVTLDLVTFIWSTPAEVFGGRLAFSGLVPIGGPSIDVGATLSPVATGARHSSSFTVGDPAISASVGWKADKWHWTTGVTGFFPIGDYHEGSLANTANHRLSVDLNGALTWLDPEAGIDVSTAMGVTFNDKNKSTNYKTGDEFHLDWAVSKKFTPAFSVGAVGYFYDQLTDDSGSGATLGAFKGRVAAIGPMVGYSFKLGMLPVSTQLRFYHEFDVKNRLEGNGGFFTLSMPLYVAGAASPAPK